MKSLSDSKCRAVCDENRNMLVPWYLMASYAYYVLDRPIVSDGLYDRLCQRLLKNWDWVEHMHKEWVDCDDLEAGTRLSTEYPSMSKAAACALAGVPYHPSLGIVGAMKQLEFAFETLADAIHDL